MQEIWLWSLGQEDPLEKKMATHPSILAWEVLWAGEPWQATVHGITETVRHNLANNSNNYRVFLRPYKFFIMIFIH